VLENVREGAPSHAAQLWQRREQGPIPSQGSRRGLAVTVALYYWTDVSRVGLFWAAFILTRPLGATLGDFLDKPLDHSGLAMSRPVASAVIAAIMIGLIVALPQRPGTHPQRSEQIAG
jgi:Repeat of Unknown Function (DUF347)